MNRKKSQKAQILEGVLAVVVNTVMFAVKLWAGMVTGSVALLADAWHTISDSLSSVFIIAAAKLASRKPDKEHPFGHGRWELIAPLLIACLLTMIGYEFITDSINRFQNRESVIYGTIALVITAASVIVKEAMAQYAFFLGRKHDNPAITADGWHHRTDSFSSVMILIGIVITRFVDGLWWMDSVLGIICALAIFFAAFNIMKDSIKRILGEEAKQEFIDEINSEVKKIYSNDLKLHHFHLHNYITHKELTLHLMLDGSKTIENGHEVATVIAKMVKEKYGVETTIHVEPLARDIVPTL